MTKEEFDKIKAEQEASMKKNEESKKTFLESLSNIPKAFLDNAEWTNKISEPLFDKLRKKRELGLQKEEEFIYKQTIFLCGKVLETIDLPEQIPNNLNISDKQIKKLCQLLQEKGYISSEVSLDTCTRIFGSKEFIYQICEDYFNYYSKINRYRCYEEAYIKSVLPDLIETKTLTARIEWTKNNSRTRQINKVSLLDLLNQLNVSFSMWHNRKYLNSLFTMNGGEPINFNPQNFKDFDKTRYKSEYFNEISDIIKLSTLE